MQPFSSSSSIYSKLYLEIVKSLQECLCFLLLLLQEEHLAVMAQGIASPVGLFSDEEAAVSLVLESTVAECGLRRALLPDFSAISADQEQVTLRRTGDMKRG